MYRVHYKGKWHTFITLDGAKEFANAIFRRTGIVVSIVSS